jgi:chorismate mutase
LIPEERPFHSGLPASRRAMTVPDTGLTIADYDTVNVTGSIRQSYLSLLPTLCGDGDDGQWGSSVEHDVICLQALGRRIHFGSLYVGESKFQENPQRFRELVAARDDDAITQMIVRVEVEQRVLARVRSKVEAVQSVSDPALRRLVDPEVVVAFFREAIIPLTKEGEIRYLYQRVGAQA